MRSRVWSIWLLMIFARPLGAESVRLTVKQEFEKTKASVPVDLPLRLFLGAAGVSVDSRAALSLVIDLSGDATPSEYRKEDYTPGARPGKITERWTSASISGFCELTRGAEKVGFCGFYGSHDEYQSTLKGGQFASRAQAPYKAAFAESDFVVGLAEALSPILDSAAMVRGLDAVARSAKLSDPMRLSALCRLTRETDATAVDRVAALLESRRVPFDSSAAIEQQREPKLAGAIAFVRLRRAVTDDERAAIAKKYRARLSSGGWCDREVAPADLGIVRAMGADGEEQLLELLKVYDRDPFERAAKLLAALKSARAVAPLSAVAARDNDDLKRMAAISALAKIGDLSACSALKEAAAHYDLTVKKSAGEAMRKLHCEDAPPP